MINHRDLDFPASRLEGSPRDLERELKELEVSAKRQELDAKKEELLKKGSGLAQWNSPIALAVLAALIGYFGTLVTWILAQKGEESRHDQTLELEAKKQKATAALEQRKLQGSLILDAMKTGEGADKTKRAAVNLLLLADAKLVEFDDGVRKKLTNWIEGTGGIGPGLPSPAPSSQPEQFDPKAYSRIHEDVAYAVSALNRLFKTNLSIPRIAPSEIGMFSYYDPSDKSIHGGAELQFAPEISYREVAHMYRILWDESPESQAAALGSATADILAMTVKQERLGHTAQTDDWLLFRSAGRTGDDFAISFKEPGAASPQDKQIGHMNRYVVRDPADPASNVARYINSGIPCKAFYEMAIRLGRDQAIEIWIKTMFSVPPPRPTFAEFAGESVRHAGELYGKSATDVAMNAWKAVGVEPANR